MKRILPAIVLAVILAFPSAAHADIAPPAQPPGSSLQPGSESTQVRMLAETILIEVMPGATDKSLGQAHVTAGFTMHNLGTTAEAMAARFPIGASDGWSHVNELRDLQVSVNGRTVSTRRISGEDPYGGSSQVPWAEFDAAFAAGQDTPVQVKYTLEASGEYPFIWFKYILASGAGWNGSIGNADIIVRLPYQVSAQNVLLNTAEVSSYDTSQGGVINGAEIRWHYADLEPTRQDNFEIELVMPSVWEKLMIEQSNVDRNPKDGEAWGRLGRLCKDLTFSSRGKGFRRETSVLDPGAAELYQRSLQAYDKAVTLLPKDALWHAGFAELLDYHAYFATQSGENTAAEAVRGLGEIQTALGLAPNDPQVQEIADELTYLFPDGMRREGNAYAFPWLTATPLPPTALAATISPTDTPASKPKSESIAASATPKAPVPVAKPSAPLCGSAALLPAVALWLVGSSIRRPKQDS
jgi:hypothetical protein